MENRGIAGVYVYSTLLIWPDMKNLSLKEQTFVDEYLRDLDPVRAAIDAGYSESTARVKSFGWVSKPDAKPAVYQAILRGKEPRSERVQIDSDEVLRHMPLNFPSMTSEGFLVIKESLRHLLVPMMAEMSTYNLCLM